MHESAMKRNHGKDGNRIGTVTGWRMAPGVRGVAGNHTHGGP